MSLRDKQIREVLDADYNISRQLRNKTTIRDDNKTPKRFRDLDVEVSVDKLVEELNNNLTRKIAGLELIMTDSKGDFNAKLVNVINISDVTSLWNQIVRLYKTPSLSRQSQDALKIKTQDLSINIDSLAYGLEKLIQDILEAGRPKGYVQDISNSLGAYVSIQQQLRSSEFRIVDQSEISSQMRSVISNLPEEFRNEVEKSFKNVQVKRTFNFPSSDFQNRIQNIESELGIKLNNIDDLKKQLPKEIQSRFTSSYGRLKENAKNIEDLESQIDIIGNKIPILEDYVERLRADDPISFNSQINDTKIVIENLENRKNVLEQLREEIRGNFGYDQDFKLDSEYNDKIENDLNAVREDYAKNREDLFKARDDDLKLGLDELPMFDDTDEVKMIEEYVKPFEERKRSESDDAEINRLLSKADTTKDFEERKAIFMEIIDLLNVSTLNEPEKEGILRTMNAIQDKFTRGFSTKSESVIDTKPTNAYLTSLSDEELRKFAEKVDYYPLKTTGRKQVQKNVYNRWVDKYNKKLSTAPLGFGKNQRVILRVILKVILKVMKKKTKE